MILTITVDPLNRVTTVAIDALRVIRPPHSGSLIANWQDMDERQIHRGIHGSYHWLTSTADYSGLFSVCAPKSLWTATWRDTQRWPCPPAYRGGTGRSGRAVRICHSP